MGNDQEVIISLVTNVDEKSLRENLKSINEQITRELATIGDLSTKHAMMNRKTQKAQKVANEIDERRAKVTKMESLRDTYQQALAYLEGKKIDLAQGRLDTSKERLALDKETEARRQEAEDRRAVERLEKQRARLRLKFSTKALGLIGRVARKFESVMIARIARGLLNAIINSARTGVQDLYKWSQSHNGMFAKAMDSIKEDFRYIADIVGSIVGPFIEELAPVIRNIADAFAEAAERANQFFAILLGRNGYYKAIRMAQQFGSLQNQLLGFDELNVLKGDTGSGGGNFEWLGLTQDKLDGLGQLISAGGYVQMGVGAILLFMGHPLVGAALIASGFANVIAAQGSSDIESKLQKKLKRISLIAAGSELALGAILIAVGRIPLGVGLLIAGIAGSVSAVALNWDAIVEHVKGPFALLSVVLGAFSLALGAVLMGVPGAWGFGLALIMAGAAGLATPIIANKDAIVNWVRTTFVNILTVVSSLTIAVGGILMLSPATFGIGLALLAAGFAAKAAAHAINPQAAEETIRNMLNAINTTVRQIWGGLVDWVVGKWNSIWSGLKSAFERIDSWLAETFGKRYGLKIDMPGNWTDSYINYHDNMYLPELYASGGTPRTGSLFYAGEAGPELVTSFNGQSTVYNETQLTGSLADANQNVVNAIYDAAANLIAAVSSKDLTIDVNDMRNAFNTQSLRYGL